MMEKLLRYFDINSSFRKKLAVGVEGTAGTAFHWLPQWLALLTGIWVSPYFAAYRTTSDWSFSGGWGRLLFAVITGVVVFPGLYKKVISEDAPWIVLLAPCFIAGLGYETLLSTALQAAAPAP